MKINLLFSVKYLISDFFKPKTFNFFAVPFKYANIDNNF